MRGQGTQRGSKHYNHSTRPIGTIIEIDLVFHLDLKSVYLHRVATPEGVIRIRKIHQFNTSLEKKKLHGSWQNVGSYFTGRVGLLILHNHHSNRLIG